MTRRLTDLQLERYQAEALSTEERAAVDEVLTKSPPDAEALRLLRAENAAFFVTQPPAAFVEKVMPTKKSPWRWLGALGAVAAAAALLLVVKTQAGTDADDDTRVKGGVGWHVTVSGQTGTRTLMEKTEVATGDTLSFQVATERQVFVAVISHAPDGWWVYAPSTGKVALRVGRGLTLIPEGAQLDETEGDEMLYLVSSDQPFEPERLRDSMKNNVVPEGLTIEQLGLVKHRR